MAHPHSLDQFFVISADAAVMPQFPNRWNIKKNWGLCDFAFKYFTVFPVIFHVFHQKIPVIFHIFSVFSQQFFVGRRRLLEEYVGALAPYLGSVVGYTYSRLLDRDGGAELMGEPWRNQQKWWYRDILSDYWLVW